MVLNAECQSLNVSAKMTLQGKDYTVFISTESMKCFNCGRYGHIKQACPLTIESESVVENEGELVNVQQVVNPALENHCLSESSNRENDEQTEMVTLSDDREQHIELESVSTSTVSANEKPVETDALLIAEVKVCNNAAVVIAGENESNDSGEQFKPAGEIQMLVDNLSQNSIDPLLEQCESQLIDYDSDSAASDEVDETELNSQGNSEGKTSSFKVKSFYSVQQINTFLDATFNQRRPKVEAYFPDLQLFVESVSMAMRKATLEELDQPKRYRLKKYMSAVKKRLKTCHKK